MRSLGVLATLASLGIVDATPNYMIQDKDGNSNCARSLTVGTTIMGMPADQSTVRFMVIKDDKGNQLNVGQGPWTYIPDHEYTIEITNDAVRDLSIVRLILPSYHLTILPVYERANTCLRSTGWSFTNVKRSQPPMVAPPAATSAPKESRTTLRMEVFIQKPKYGRRKTERIGVPGVRMLTSVAGYPLSMPSISKRQPRCHARMDKNSMQTLPHTARTLLLHLLLQRRPPGLSITWLGSKLLL
jgi:hypothetical protein